MTDMTELGRAVGVRIKEAVGAIAYSLSARIDAISARMDGISESVERSIAEAVEALPAPKDGASVTLDDVAPLVADEVAKAMESLPAVSVPAESIVSAILTLPELFDEAAQKHFADNPPPKGEDGKDADPETVAALVADAVEKAVSAIPAPKDGESVTADDVLPELRKALEPIIEECRATVAAIPAPKDGKSVSPDEVAEIVASHQAKWELDFERRAQGVLERAIERMPKAKDGVDGIGFDDLSVTHDGERTIKINFQRGDVAKTFDIQIPATIYRGIFQAGGAYDPGDMVTWAGSVWHCNERTSEKPADGSKGWTLAAKRGRDGKDGERGKDYTPPQPVKLP